MIGKGRLEAGGTGEGATAVYAKPGFDSINDAGFSAHLRVLSKMNDFILELFMNYTPSRLRRTPPLQGESFFVCRSILRPTR